MEHENKETAARDFYHPVSVDRDPDDDWTFPGHSGMDNEYEAEPPLVKATRVWDGIVVASHG